MKSYNHRAFKCPKEKKDHICPECFVLDICNEEGKKRFFNACSYLGVAECECGYSEDLCMFNALKKCPFCSRDIETPNSIYKYIITRFENILVSPRGL